MFPRGQDEQWCRREDMRRSKFKNSEPGEMFEIVDVMRAVTLDGPPVNSVDPLNICTEISNLIALYPRENSRSPRRQSCSPVGIG